MNIVLEGIGLRYGENWAIRDLNFSIGEGEVHGLLGPNGAGKTTTLKILCGLLRPSEGRVLFDGRERTSDLQNKIGFLPETLPLYYDLSVSEYLTYISQLKDVERRQIGPHTSEIMELLDLNSVKERNIGNLSRGLRQRVAIAQALVAWPKLIVLDEPTLGLDPSSINDIRNLIKVLKQKSTVLVSSHLLHEIELTCDSVTIINRGQLLVSNSLSELKKSYSTDQVISLQIEGTGSDRKKLADILPELSILDFEKREKEVSAKVLLGSKWSLQDLLRSLDQNDMKLLEFKREAFELEDLFLQVTNEEGPRHV